MKRTRMIWLALGIAVGLVAAMIPSLVSEDEVIYLTVLEPDVFLPNQPNGRQDRSVIEEAWRCGARNFRAELPTHGYIIQIPISSDQLKVINCIVGNKANETSFDISFVSKSK